MPDRRAQIIDGLETLISLQRHVDFQRLALQLAKSKWPEIEATAERNDGGEDGTSFITCADGKKRAVACSLTGTLTKVRADATRIRERGVTIDALVFITPVNVDHLTVSDWCETIAKEFKHELHVIPQSELATLLEQPSNDWLCRERLNIPARETLIDELRVLARQGSARLIVGWKQEERFSVLPTIPLSLRLAGGTSVMSLAEIRQQLLARRRIVLTGVPGAGKTFTVIQLADQLAQDTSQPIPLLLSLPGWAAAQVDLPTYIARQLGPEGIDINAVDRLLKSGTLLLLLNGWNEVAEHAVGANAALRLQDFARNHPETPLLVSTRTSRLAPPLTSPVVVEVLPLTFTQKSALIHATGIPNAGELITQLNGDPVLSEVTDTPLFFSAILELVRAGQPLPRTRYAILEALIRLLEASPTHQGALANPPCDGLARTFLAHLAKHLTDAGAVVCTEDEARQVVGLCAQKLAAAGQLSPMPASSAVLDVLVNHHILVRSAVTGGSIRFSHQQFQEWFAAEALQQQLLAITAQPTPASVRQFQEQILNRPRWTEALHFLMQRLGVENSESRQRAATLVGWCVPIDPVFACALAASGGPEVWSLVRGTLVPMIRSWHAQPALLDKALARAAIFASESPDFSDLIWPILETRDRQGFLSSIRTGYPFVLSCLGPDWRARIARLPDDFRSLFARESSRQDSAAIPLLVDLVQNDPSAKVRRDCLVELRYRAGSARVGQLLRTSDPLPWDSELHESILRNLPDRELSLLAPRIKQSLAESTNPPFLASLLELLERCDDPDWLTLMQTTLAPDWPPDLVVPIWQKLKLVDPVWADAWWNDHRAGRLRPDQPPPATSDNFAGLFASFLPAPHSNPARRIIDKLPLPVLAREILREAGARTDANQLFLLAALLPCSPGRARQYRTELDVPVRTQLRALALRIEALLDPGAETTPRCRADLAMLLGCVGRDNDTVIIEQWIFRDHSELEQARADPKAPGARNRSYVSYANIYAGAVASLAGPAADELLGKLLGNPETMGDAASLLTWRAHGYKEPDNQSHRRTPLDLVTQRRNWATQVRTPEDIALSDRIFAALRAQWPDANEAPARFSVFGLERILETLVTLGDLRILPYLLTVARVSHHAHTGASLLRGLAMKGAPVSGRDADTALDKHFAPNAGEVEHDINKLFWAIRNALSALLLSDAPELGLARMGALPATWFQSHLIDDLILLVAECPAAIAMDYLLQLARDRGADERAAYALANAFLRHPDPRAYTGLLVLLDHALIRASSYTYSLLKNFGALIRQQPELLAEIERRCVPTATPRQRRLLADLLREVGTHDAAMLYTRILSPDPEFTSNLESDAEAFAMTKVPVSRDGSAYTLAAVDTSAWRAALWGIVRTEPARAKVALELLQHVYFQRMEYGWPADEPRHPDIATFASDSGPWPVQPVS